MIGQQAIMDAYLCLLHLTAGILVGRLVYTYYVSGLYLDSTMLSVQFVLSTLIYELFIFL